MTRPSGALEEVARRVLARFGESIVAHVAPDATLTIAALHPLSPPATVSEVDGGIRIRCAGFDLTVPGVDEAVVILDAIGTAGSVALPGGGTPVIVTRHPWGERPRRLTRIPSC